MIQAKQSRIARLLFNPYLNHILKRHFSGFCVMNKFPLIGDDEGLLITPNHFSWWDGFFIDFITRRYSQRQIHILMLEEQLKRYWFFRYLGAYSINDNKPKSIVETASYTSTIIQDPHNFVVFYPQGKMEPYDKRPLELKEGLLYFLKKLARKTTVIPAAFKIQYSEEMKPSIYVRFGRPLYHHQILSSFDDFRCEFNENISMLDKSAPLTKPAGKFFWSKY